MSKSRSYLRLLEAVRESDCPICRLLLEDSRAYLDQLFYESVLDVPTRMMLMKSFGFCSWHARQIPRLPEICAPNVGFAIFASDLLRKLDYAARPMVQQRRGERTWKSWFGKKSRSLFSLMKESSCPACDRLKEFESYHLKDLLDSLGDSEFLAAYKTSQGICLPHFFMLEESCSSHGNFSLLLEAQLAKAQALRDELEEFIRKQDFRFSDELTPEETTAWHRALDALSGKPDMFANEMGHDLFRRSAQRGSSQGKPKVALAPAGSYTVKELITELKSSEQVTLYLKKPLPAALFDGLRQLAGERPSRTIEAVVEGLNDVAYLRRLHAAGVAVFYGIALPTETIVLLDNHRGFLLEEDRMHPNVRLRSLKNPEDVRLNLLWHRFGIALSLSGAVKENDRAKGLFCVMLEGRREQWCCWKDPAAKLPQVGATVEVFGWDKWNSRILEVLELQVIEPGQATAR